jgi:hypothetical protein
MGTQSAASRIFSPGRGIDGPDVPQIFSGVKKIFAPSKDTKPVAQTPAANAEVQTTLANAQVQTTVIKEEIELPPQFSFGVVYANALAETEIVKENPNFPVGSIIVREKNETAASLTPQIVIAMVKREKGFSEKTGDWEFFVFDGADLRSTLRETTGSCAACHARAEKTDWVFRDYLNK